MIGDVMNGATAAMTTPPPPLPELGDLVERSEWLRGQPGLEAEVRRWHGSLGTERDRIVAEAEEVQGVLEHALLYGVFHGDLHAGNVLIDEAGNFSLVDFGIAGRLDPSVVSGAWTQRSKAAAGSRSGSWWKKGRSGSSPGR